MMQDRLGSKTGREMIVRLALGVASAAAVAMPAVARCPERMAGATVAAWGKPVARDQLSTSVFRPSGIKMLGRDVPYVQVTFDRGGMPVNLAFRLGSETWKDRLSQSLAEAFRADFGPDAKCENGCEIPNRDNQPVGRLSGAEAGGTLPGYDNGWRGTGIDLLVADEAKAASGGAQPAFLFCYYRSQDDFS